MANDDRLDPQGGKTVLESSDPGDTLDLGEEEGDVSEPEVTPEALGRYEVRREIASGGIGRIMLAFDRHVGRPVALKEILPHLLPDKDSRGRTPKSPSRMVKARFLREARVTGQLEHPAIVPVYEIGRHPDGTYYYTMRLVDGKTLAQAIAESLDLTERLALLPHFYNLCNAIAYAHSRGVLHRDIKPENVMIGPFGETVVLDWGLAKVRGERDHGARHLERSLSIIKEGEAGEKTMSGRVVGTPAYMPPEQARGEIERLDERSDVYALGAVLYEMLTGKRPFEGKTSYEILEKVINEKPIPILLREPRAPVELVAIAERAMRKQQGERYATVAEMTQDINNYLAGRRVSAYRYSFWELVRKFFYTNRTIAVTGIVAFLLTLLGAMLVYREYLHAQESLAVSRSFLFAERSREYEKAKNRGASAVLAAAALLHNPVVAHHFTLPGVEKRHPEMFSLYADIRSRLYQTELGLGAQFKGSVASAGTVWAVAVSPDERLVAAGGHAKGERVIRLYDRDSGAVRGELKGITGNVYALAFSPDGSLLAAATQEPRVLLWEIGSCQQKKPLSGPTAALFGVSFSPDGKKIAAAGLDGYLRVWDTLSGDLLVETEAHREGALAVAFSPDETMIASGGWDKRVVLWDSGKGRLARVVGEHRDAVSALAFSPDGRRLVSGGHDRTMAFWNLVTEEQRVIHGHVGPITALSYTSDGRYLASAGDDTAVKLWDPATGELLLRVEGHRKTVATAVLHGLRFLVTGGNDRLVKFWELVSGRETIVYRGHTAPVSAAALLPGTTLLLSIAEDSALRFWDVANGLEILQLETHPGPRALAVSPRGTFIAVGGWDRRIRVWRSGEIAPAADLKGHTDTVRALSFSPDETILLSTGDDSTTRLWRPSGEVTASQVSGHYGPVLSATFLGDGSWYATGGVDGMVLLRETASGKEIGRIESAGAVRALVSVPRDDTLIVAGESSEILFYSTHEQGLRKRIDVGERGVMGLALSPDGATLVAVCESGAVRLFSTADGRPRLVLETVGGRTVLFGPTGEHLIVSDGTSLRRYPAVSLVFGDDPEMFFSRIQCTTGLRLSDTGVEPLDEPCDTFPTAVQK